MQKIQLLLTISFLLLAITVYGQDSEKPEQAVTIVGKVDNASMVNKKTITIKIGKDVDSLTVDSMGNFAKEIKGTFDFKRPVLALLGYSATSVSSDSDSELNRRYFLIDTNTIHIVVLVNSKSIVINGGYENKVQNAFKELDDDFFPLLNEDNLNASSLDSISVLKYHKDLELIRKHNDSYVSYNRLRSLFRPSAFSIREDIKFALQHLEPNAFSPSEHAEILKAYTQFVQENTLRLDDAHFPELDLVKHGDSPEFDLLLQKYEYILIDIWATWCGPCIEQHPIVNTFATKIKNNKKLAVTGLAISCAQSHWEKHLDENPFNYPSYWLDKNNSQKLVNQLKVDAIPRYVLLRTSDNTLVEKHIDINQLESTLSKYLPNATF